MATLRQKEAVKNVLENRGMGISKAMELAEYKKNTAKNPKNLTESKGWQELMEQYLPDKELAKVHKEGLKATRPFSSHTEPDREVPDYAVRHKYLETAYKVKKKIEPELPEKPPQLQIIKEQKNIYLVVAKAEEEIKKELEK